MYPKALAQRFSEMSARHARITPSVLRDVAACRTLAFWQTHNADFMQQSDRMAAGRILDGASHTRDRVPEGLFGIKPDMLDYERRIVVEKKASLAGLEASVIQLGAYCALLAAATDHEWHGEIFVFSINRRNAVELDADLMARVIAAFEDCLAIRSMKCPPWTERHGLCGGCSSRELCGYM